MGHIVSRVDVQEVSSMAIPTKAEMKRAFLERIESAKGQDFTVHAKTFTSPEETLAELAPALLKRHPDSLKIKTKSPWHGLH